MKEAPKAGIVGAGILGRLLAFQLSLRGWQVTLFDQHEESGRGSCSIAAAGMLAPIMESVTQDPIIYAMGVQGIEWWKTLIAEHRWPVFFEQKGTVLMANAGDELDLHFIANRMIQRLGEEEVQGCNWEMLYNIEPELQARNTYFLPREAQLDARAVLQTVGEELKNRGVVCYFSTPVTQIQPHTISSAGGNFSFDWVFDCRGIGAQSDWPDLRPVRGELIYLYAPDVRLTRVIRLHHPRYPTYIIPRPNHIYLIGATEIESADHSSVSVRSALELLSAAYSVHSGFFEARIIETVTGLRPTFSNHLPRIHYEPGLLRLNGLYRHGFLLAPPLVDEAIRLCESGKNTSRYPELMSEGICG